jgi:MarR family transcriptional regulator, lower aerobic nicotinate degradation pathway regulator
LAERRAADGSSIVGPATAPIWIQFSARLRSDRASAAAHEQLSPVDGLAQLSFVIQGMLERRAAEHDLSVIQTRLLGILRDRTPTMNELARFLGLDKSSVTGLVDRAERRGLVARVPSTTDRRAVLVSLTDDGRSLVSQAAAGFGTDVSALLGLLPPRDRDALARIVSRLLVAHAADQGIDLFATAAGQPRLPDAGACPRTSTVGRRGPTRSRALRRRCVAGWH